MKAHPTLPRHIEPLRSRRRLSLTWIDFLVVAATILTFAAVFSAVVSRG
jgi:uncharacterized paraquat-inducible protein A